jgi:hypothetical protein
MVDPRLIPSDNTSQKKHHDYNSGSVGLWKIVRQLCLCSPMNPMSWFGICLAQTLWNRSQSWMTPWAEQWFMYNWCTKSSIITRHFSRIMAYSHLMFSSVVDVDGHHLFGHFWTWLSICTYFTVVKQLPYFVGSLWWISSPGTPSAHRNHTTAHCASSVCTERRVAMLTLLWWHYNWPLKVESISQSHREFVLLPACKISIAANTSSLKINHCGNFLTYLHLSQKIGLFSAGTKMKL